MLLPYAAPSIETMVEKEQRLTVDELSAGGKGIVSKRLGSKYRGGRSADWIKVKNPAAPAVKREA
jgi:ATP-dependent DNA ligase